MIEDILRKKETCFLLILTFIAILIICFTSEYFGVMNEGSIDPPPLEVFFIWTTT